MAKSKEAIAVWRGGTEFEATAADSGFSARTDGGGGKAMSPMEMLLVALAGCTGADVISILEKKRQNVTALEVRVRGDRAAEPPRKYTHVEIVYVVTGHGVDPEAVRRSIELSETKYCSVSASLGGVPKITTRFEIREAEPIAA
jgi:putative redox protein